MKKKLLRLALISAPILALYGIAPVYFFIPLRSILTLGAFVFLTLLIFIFWIINIYLLDYVKGDNLKRYLLSYAATVLFQTLMSLMAPKFQVQEVALGVFAYPLVSTLAINTIILVVIHSILLQHQKEMADLEVKNLKVSSLEAQRQVLLQQLQPHFLFNALSTLKSLIKEDPDRAEMYSLKLSEFLRYSVQSHTDELVTLEKELRFTEDYIDLQKTRFGNALTCTIDLPANVQHEKLPIYALQTLVENAIKHNRFTEKKPLLIQVYGKNDQLTVANNKLPKQLIALPGTGLYNLNQRYKMVSDHSLQITETESSFQVTIKLL